jgi:hypothetical protein
MRWGLIKEIYFIEGKQTEESSLPSEFPVSGECLVIVLHQLPSLPQRVGKPAMSYCGEKREGVLTVDQMNFLPSWGIRESFGQLFSNI